MKFSTTVVEALFETAAVIPSGLRGEIYHIAPESFAIPNFAKLKPVGVIYTNGLNIPARAFTEGFPGVTDRIEWFAIDYKGTFYIAKTGKYEFFLVSDDGSKLYIDGRVVIDNDGVHIPRRADCRVTLSGGLHSIRVSYFQGPRFDLALVLGVREAGTRQWRVFNTNEFKPPADDLSQPPNARQEGKK